MTIGIMGALGSGKGTVADYLVRHHSFTYLSVRNYLAGEVVRAGKEVNFNTIRKMGVELRAAHTPAYLIEQLLTQTHGPHLVIESLRLPEEVAAVKGWGGIIWDVQTALPLRYDRSVARDAESRSVTLEQFRLQEASEEAVLAAIYPLASTVLTNNGTKQELFEQVEKALQA